MIVGLLSIRAEISWGILSNLQTRMAYQGYVMQLLKCFGEFWSNGNSTNYAAAAAIPRTPAPIPATPSYNNRATLPTSTAPLTRAIFHRCSSATWRSSILSNWVFWSVQVNTKKVVEIQQCKFPPKSHPARPPI